MQVEKSNRKIHDCARRIWLHSSTMPYTRLHHMDYYENEFAVKPQPKFLNGALQQTHGKQQEWHEPGNGVEGVMEQQPSE
ncbi:hypothetical protein EUGRSUZ_D00554 [Eucalyptus grandis]|uniref:Uncharacterized protein n=2 Tax=Eucalyptus grandis TaxID=71139 RepID=A0ACC3L517_EUCGR|nr:hypothetical protein EUGRSUZ_D00554 [Eucalyptus grandis]